MNDNAFINRFDFPNFASNFKIRKIEEKIEKKNRQNGVDPDKCLQKQI